MDRVNTDDQADNKSPAPKRGYSIWSLLVIMTLLAVWLAVPRRWAFERLYLEMFVVFHQLTLWLLVGSLIWIVTGRKRSAGVTIAIVVFIALAPGICGVLEFSIWHTHFTNSIVEWIGLRKLYFSFYLFLERAFGYGPRI